MKRYLIIDGDSIISKDEIVKDDLLNKLRGFTDAVIDTKNGTCFDPLGNQWVEIK